MSILTLISSDEQKFTIEKKIAIQSFAIKNMANGGSVFFLSKVDSGTLSLVIELLNKQASLPMDDLKGFVEDRKLSALLDLVSAASFLGIKGLMDVVSEKVADLIKNKTVEEVREIFEIKNDFTPEKEKAIRADNVL